MRAVFLGGGDLALRTIGRLGPGIDALVMRRHPEQLPAGIRGIRADYTQPGALRGLEELAPDYLVLTLKPLARDVEGYRLGFLTAVEHLLRGLGEHRSARILFVSSTRVYAQQNGGWVDEESPLQQTDPAAMMICAAERTLQASGLPVTLVRSAGIYGGPDGFLQRRVATGSLCPPEPIHFSNRIHREDLGALLAFLLQQDMAGVHLADCYNAVDDLPAPQHEVEAWLAQQMGVDPAAVRYDAKPMTSGHKRCSNRRLHAAGFTLAYPDYRAGYGAALAGAQ